MTEWDRLRRRAQMIKDRYPAGTRIMLLHMGNDPNPIAPNTRGTVVAVDDIGTVHCDFDNGKTLSLRFRLSSSSRYWNMPPKPDSQ